MSHNRNLKILLDLPQDEDNNQNDNSSTANHSLTNDNSVSESINFLEKLPGEMHTRIAYYLKNSELANVGLTSSAASFFQRTLDNLKLVVFKFRDYVTNANYDEIAKLLKINPDIMFSKIGIGDATAVKLAVYYQDIHLCKLLWEYAKNDEHHKNQFITQYQSQGSKKNNFSWDNIILAYQPFSQIGVPKQVFTLAGGGALVPPVVHFVLTTMSPEVIADAVQNLSKIQTIIPTHIVKVLCQEGTAWQDPKMVDRFKQRESLSMDCTALDENHDRRCLLSTNDSSFLLYRGQDEFAHRIKSNSLAKIDPGYLAKLKWDAHAINELARINTEEFKTLDREIGQYTKVNTKHLRPGFRVS